LLRGSHSKVQDLAPWSVVEEALEPTGCERGVARGLLDIGVPHVGLDRPGVVAIVGELKPRGMPQHVGVDLDAEIGFDAGALDHAAESRCRERCAALGHEHEGRLHAIALMLPQFAHFLAGQWVGGRVRRETGKR
jgi:hypothetical protein